MFGKRSKKDLLKWQRTVFPSITARRLTEAELEQMSALLAENAIRIINESLTIEKNTANEEIRRGRVVLIKEQAALLERIRPYLASAGNYPVREVEALLKRYPDLPPVRRSGD